MHNWPRAREIAKQEILRLDDEKGQAKFKRGVAVIKYAAFHCDFAPTCVWERAGIDSQHVGCGVHLPVSSQKR